MPEDRKDRREKMAKEAKTNAMRMLDRQKVKYEAFSYECDEFIDGIHSADKIGAPYVGSILGLRWLRLFMQQLFWRWQCFRIYHLF